MRRELDEGAYRALARSSPWLWSTLRFTHEERWPDGAAGGRERPVRAWLRRPDRLRVEHRDTGEVLSIVHEEPRGGMWLTSDGGAPRPPLLATDTRPAVRPDGLVGARAWELDTDAPMYGSYLWVAMLDPAELADGSWERDATRPATELADLREVEHHGRPAWEAMVRPTTDYSPRCECCPLLLHTETARPPPPEVERAEAHRVRLDFETGVCVEVRQLGGTHDGWTLDVAIETVDEPMPDELFVQILA